MIEKLFKRLLSALDEAQECWKVKRNFRKNIKKIIVNWKNNHEKYANSWLKGMKDVY